MNPIFLAIILGEVAFWMFLALGLLCRYVWKKEKLSLVLLAATPLIDLFLLGVTFIDLSTGTKPTFFHGLSAAYIAFSIVYSTKPSSGQTNGRTINGITVRFLRKSV
ncbi:hypothetical protein OC195_11740 [Priestia flexa]|nr:hypothetical protein OC195_11740 [Priestia flexa]